MKSPNLALAVKSSSRWLRSTFHAVKPLIRCLGKSKNTGGTPTKPDVICTAEEDERYIDFTFGVPLISCETKIEIRDDDPSLARSIRCAPPGEKPIYDYLRIRGPFYLKPTFDAKVDRPFRFLDLPAEIRLQIYGDILRWDRPIYISTRNSRETSLAKMIWYAEEHGNPNWIYGLCGSWHDLWQPWPNVCLSSAMKSILHVCKFIQQEATPIYYNENEFSFLGYGSLDRWLRVLDGTNAASLRRLRIRSSTPWWLRPSTDLLKLSSQSRDILMKVRQIKIVNDFDNFKPVWEKEGIDFWDWYQRQVNTNNIAPNPSLEPSPTISPGIGDSTFPGLELVDYQLGEGGWFFKPTHVFTFLQKGKSRWKYDAEMAKVSNTTQSAVAK
jgi:2EXR family